MRACLFSEEESDVRALLRSGADDEAIIAAIRRVLELKPPDHGLAGGITKRTMSQIGG
jgi:cyclic pyranopterin phosphate synthase